MYVRQIFGVSTPRNVLRMYIREIFGGSTRPKYLTAVDPSNISPKIIDGCMSVKYLGALHPQNI